jgi:omega-6 fatty acid desaturase (delta-12 desaturase)
LNYQAIYLRMERLTLKTQLKHFRQSSDAKAGLWCACDIALFLAATAGVVAAEATALKIALGVLAGLQIARLFVIGHDACHQSLFVDRRMNRWMGRVVFLPSLTTYGLWETGHNLGHHVFTNLRGKDYVWTPLSKTEYDAKPAYARALHRFYRSGFGYWAYYLLELWWSKLMFPRGELRPAKRGPYLADLSLVLGFVAAWLGALAAFGVFTDQSVLLLLATGFVLPFFVWTSLMGSVIYFHHTHPELAWYDDPVEWEAARNDASTTVLITLPFGTGAILHHIMEHPAHHLDVRVPLYRLAAAQRHLDAQPTNILTQPLTVRHIVDCTRRCKLYDYERHEWTDFAGKPTSAPLRGKPPRVAVA